MELQGVQGGSLSGLHTSSSCMIMYDYEQSRLLGTLLPAFSHDVKHLVYCTALTNYSSPRHYQLTLSSANLDSCNFAMALCSTLRLVSKPLTAHIPPPSDVVVRKSDRRRKRRVDQGPGVGAPSYPCRSTPLHILEDLVQSACDGSSM